MYNNGKWENPKVVMYCQIGGAIDMAEFSINSAIENAGLPVEDFDLVFICWKTPPKTYEWLKKNNYKYVDMKYDEGRGFLWNLYKGWNLGYKIGLEHADFICPIATDHAFYTNWLKNLLKHGKENRIVNCKLIEPGTISTLHTYINLGLTVEQEFQQEKFDQFCGFLMEGKEDKLVIEDIDGLYHQNRGIGGTYGHRLDAMPFLVHRSVWNKFGPMNQGLNIYGTTGDTDFFDRCRMGGVEIAKSLDAISYHCGGAETKRNQAQGIYT